VLDTNVLISAALSRLGKPFACLDWTLDNATLIVSRELLEELETRLARPKFSKYVDDAGRRAFVAALGLIAIQVELSGAVKVCRDPDDNKLLDAAGRRARRLLSNGRSGFARPRSFRGNSDFDA